jgi:uncharacterized protein
MRRASLAGRLLFQLILVLGALWLASEARAADSAALPGPLGYVSDHAGVLDPDWKARIRSVCQDLERKQAVEMVMVTVPDLAAFGSVQDYAAALYQRWGIGTTQEDRGILVLATVSERQIAVVAGSSLRERIPPHLQGTLAERNVQALFRSAQYGEGLYRLIVSLASAAQQTQGGGGRNRMKGLGILLTTVTGVGALAFLWWISRPDLRHPYRRVRRGEYWGTGRGGFGGNFGGFGGGTSGEGLK